MFLLFLILARVEVNQEVLGLEGGVTINAGPTSQAKSQLIGYPLSFVHSNKLTNLVTLFSPFSFQRQKC